jgi:hypothetical protein
MASPVVPIAPIPFPPDTYDQRYFNETIRTLNLYFRLLQNPGPLVGTSLSISALPTSSAGLRVGDVWVDTGAGNVLKVVL